MSTSAIARLFVVACIAVSSACAFAGNRGHAASRRTGVAQRVTSDDVDTFWTAYDDARAATDSVAQVRILQSRYIDRGTAGVRAFMVAKDYTAEEWVGAIRRYPKFWASIRPNTYQAKVELQRVAPYITKLRALYPALRPATIHLAIGALRSGGTTQDSVVLIGAELASGAPETDISEFAPDMHAFLARYFAARPLTLLVPLNVHEYVHTQQRAAGPTVLAFALREGSADLVTELVTGVRMPLPYMAYGPAHEPELRERFHAQMFSSDRRNWFYNQTSTTEVPDLGYYMGYAIARTYYDRSPDKRRAVREMIELAFDDDTAVVAFLDRSGHYPLGADRAASRRAWEARRPAVTRVVPLAPDGTVDPAATELRIEFSAPMAPYTAIDFGAGGRAAYPIVGRVGFSTDRRAYVVRVTLQPGRSYGFVLGGSEGSGFHSADGYPLRPDTITFTTRAAAP